MKSLVFAEKPSVAKEMARVLKCNEKNKGYFEGKDYIVTWALGHLATLYEPGDYDAAYKNWSMESLPIIPEKMKIKRLKKTSHQYKTVSFLMKRKDVKELIIATDAGREGELVARWTMLLAGFKKPFKRMWISSQTDKAIKDGFANLKPGNNYDRLFNAAVCRAEADWLVGLNLSRALTCHFNTQLSAGRVQTPTLSMIVEREDEIKNFKPVPFWELKAEFDGYFGHWRNKKSGSGRIFDLEFAEKLKDRLEGKAAVVARVESKERSEDHPLAYDLTELQRDGNKRFGFSAKKTLSVLQVLYERHKLVTYPRTDSRYISSDMVATLPERLISLKNTKYDKFVNKILSKPINTTKRFVDNQKVTDHHAIIPTEEKPNLENLSTDERKVYDLIVKRFLAVLFPKYRYKEIKISTEISNEEFVSKGKELISLGWREIANVDASDNGDSVELVPEQKLSLEEKGSHKKVLKLLLSKSNTRPPAKFTEAELLARMEKGNLGTPATRAEIIEKLLSSFYIERNGKQLNSTSKGKQLVNLVPEMMKSPELTADWEAWLEAIARGKASPKKFIENIRGKTKELVSEVKGLDVKFKLDNLTKQKCPMCGKYMLKVKGKKRREMLVCQDRECGYRENIIKKNDTSISVSKRDKAMNKKLISKYSDNKEETGLNLGQLLENFIK